VLTPEDDYAVWEGAGERLLIAPLHFLHDYSFRPDDVAPENAPAWAAAAGTMCADEELLDPSPFPTIAAWCGARCAATETRLERAVRETGLRTVLINHFPLKQASRGCPSSPASECGAERDGRRTGTCASVVVVSGHLHIRKTSFIDGCRFEEVSLGHPYRQWHPANGVDHYIRQIVPAGDHPSCEPSGEKRTNQDMAHDLAFDGRRSTEGYRRSS
jgi:hypothetical protein